MMIAETNKLLKNLEEINISLKRIDIHLDKIAQKSSGPRLAEMIDLAKQFMVPKKEGN